MAVLPSVPERAGLPGKVQMKASAVNLSILKFFALTGLYLGERIEMQNITIDEEYKSLLPKLDEITFELLERNIIENGCRDALVLWGEILIDGHNRYAICIKHDIPFETVNIDFATREEATIWIIRTQVSRRNLSPMQLSYFRGLHHRADKKLVTNPEGKNRYSLVEGHNDLQLKNRSTADRLAELYDISSKTIARDAKGADGIDAIGVASPEAKRMLLDGEAKMDKNYLMSIADMDDQDIAEIAARIESGTHDRRKPKPPAATTADENGGGGNSGDGGGDGGGGSNGGDGGNGGGNGGGGGEPGSNGNTLYGDLLSLTDDFSTELWSLVKAGETGKLKTSLRAYIDSLEKLYERFSDY